MSATDIANLKAEAIRLDNSGNFAAADRLFAIIAKG